jgi:cytoskeleton protein RodZ
MTDEIAPRTPGEMLREAREARRFSVADISECTKIPPWLVEAMERDEYHKLSGGLYVKSFLRTYAGCVGLEAEALLAVYEQATGSGTPPPPEPDADGGWTEAQTTVRRVGLSAGAIVGRVALILGALAVVGVLVWRLMFADQGG